MTATEAEDEILGIFKEAWDTTGFVAKYNDIPEKEVPDTEDGVDSPWARATVLFAPTGGQASLAGEQGARRWNQNGTVIVQVFAPVGDGKQKLREMAQLVVNAYREVRGTQVWIRNPRMRDVQSEGGAFSQMNVLADFQFDDVR